MKTIIFILGLTVGIYSAHYYHHSKTEYFDSLYTSYSSSLLNQLTLLNSKQVEQKWLANTPWCFTNSNESLCNLAARTSNPENNQTNSIPDNLSVTLHQKIIIWYPMAQKQVISAFDYISTQIQNYITHYDNSTTPIITNDS
jgi:hypothetical protein